MVKQTNLLTQSEKAVFSLRSLYAEYGYSQYKMSKFEEYDLYVKNKDYLLSDAIITFTDTDGKLLALKPDVTLSIIKNTKSEEGLKKLCYAENVYRPSKGTNSFKEIMQVGLECLGDIDDYVLCEVISLAVQSLKTISNDYVLDISHLGIVSALLDDLSITESAKKQALRYLADKNVQELQALINLEGADCDSAKALITLSKLFGNPQRVISELSRLNLPSNANLSLEQLKVIIEQLKELGLADNVNIDFSVVNDMNYYNGIVFKGFINGIPTGILSGGQYDKLMQRMGKKFGAIGFAVYMDELESLAVSEDNFDADAVVLYTNSTPLSQLTKKVSELKKAGNSVLVTKGSIEKLKYKQLIKM